MELTFKEANIVYWTYRAGQDGTLTLGESAAIIFPIADRYGMKATDLIDVAEARIEAWFAARSA